MKHIYKVSLVLFLLLSLSLSAQITIVSNDLPQVGTILATSSAVNPSIEVLNADANAQNWDWTSLENEAATAVVFTPTTGIVGAGDFPDADFARTGSLAALLGFDLGGLLALDGGNNGLDATAYFREGTDGNVYIDGGAIPLNFDTLDLGTQLLEADGNLRFYSTGEYGDTYNSSGMLFTDIYLDQFGIEIPLLAFIRLSFEIDADVEIDAFGEMALPDTTMEVLRYNESNTIRAKLAPWGELLGFPFEIPLDGIELPDSLLGGVDLSTIFFDTTFTAQSMRFYANGLEYPLASANVQETDSSTNVLSVEYYGTPPAVTAQITINDSITNCGQVFLIPEATGASLTYTWDFGDGEMANNVFTQHTYTQNGTYTVILNVEDGFGDTAGDTITVEIDCPTIVGFGANTPPDSCQQVFIVNNSEGLGLSYNWDFGDGNMSDTDDGFFTYNYDEDGTYDITLTVTDGDGASQNSIQTVTVDCESGLSASFGAANNPDNCQQVSFTNNATNYSSLIWDFGDDNQSTEINPVYDYTADGVYEVILSATGTFGSVVSDTQTVVVNCSSTLIPAFTITQPSDSCQQVSLPNSSIGLNISYLWDFGDGTQSTEASPVHNYTQDGEYTITLTVTDELNNESSTSNEVEIMCVMPGISSINLIGNYRVFPQPTTNYLNLWLEQTPPSNSLLRIVDVNGKTVLENNIESNQMNLSVQDLSSGIYILKLIGETGILLTHKIIKE